MVTTHAGDEREGKEGVLYVAACSVEDPLVPVCLGLSLSLHLVLIISCDDRRVEVQEQPYT